MLLRNHVFLGERCFCSKTNPERKLNNDIVSLVFVYVRRNSTCLHTDDKENVIRLLTATCLTSSQTKTRCEIYTENLSKPTENLVCVSPVLLTDVLSWVAVSVRSDRHMGLVQEALAAFFPRSQMQDALANGHFVLCAKSDPHMPANARGTI